MSERLEKIKKKQFYNVEYVGGSNYNLVNFDDFEWLIEQAERVEELKQSDLMLGSLGKENERHREALIELRELIANTTLPSSFWPVALGKIDEVLEGEADERN